MLVKLELQCVDIVLLTTNKFIPEIGLKEKFIFLKNFRVTGGDICKATIETVGPSYINSSEHLSGFIDIVVMMTNLKWNSEVLLKL